MVKPTKTSLNLSFSDDEQPDKQYVERLMACFSEIRAKGASIRSKSEKLEEAIKKYRSSKSSGTQRLAAVQKQTDILSDSIRKTLDAVYKARRIKDEERMKSKQLVRGALVNFLADQARRLPLYISEPGSHPPPLVGAIPAQPDTVIELGDFAAAFSEEMGMWILAVITGVQGYGANMRFRCHDIEDESKEMILTKRRIVPLPRYRANPQGDAGALFPADAVVMAMYPQTTCFYKAAVSAPPTTATDDYLIAFDDSTSITGYADPLSVPQRYVLTYREDPQKKSKSTRDKRKTMQEDDDE
uniref:SGF29 C-terminal domain-containing protein n=1 Tax=Steinernema glaseri TaxID=37863 RepID=A0A1I7Y032_9BILA